MKDFVFSRDRPTIEACEALWSGVVLIKTLHFYTQCKGLSVCEAVICLAWLF